MEWLGQSVTRSLGATIGAEPLLLEAGHCSLFTRNSTSSLHRRGVVRSIRARPKEAIRAVRGKPRARLDVWRFAREHHETEQRATTRRAAKCTVTACENARNALLERT